MRLPVKSFIVTVCLSSLVSVISVGRKWAFSAVFSHLSLVCSPRDGVPLGLKVWKLVPKN